MRRMQGKPTQRTAQIAECRSRAQRQRHAARKLEKFAELVTSQIKAGRSRNSRISIEATPELREDITCAIDALTTQARSWIDVAHHLESLDPPTTGSD